MGSLDEIPIDILRLIAEKIADHADVIRFGAVCREFCTIVRDNLHLLPSKLPLSLCVLPKIRNKWIVGSRHGWLVTVDTRGQDIHLSNPLTRAQIPLPSLNTFQHPKGGFGSGELNDFGFVEKAVISSDPSNQRRKLDNNDDDCILAMAIISNFHVLSFCRVGDDKWTNVEDSPIHILDVIWYKGQVYAVTYEGMAVVYDFAGDKKIKQIANSLDSLIGAERYLVESTNGDLLQVVRVVYGDDPAYEGYEDDEDDEVMLQTIDIYVYKLEAVDEPVKPRGRRCTTLNNRAPKRGQFYFKWVEIESLGDQALFLGQNYSLCLPAVEYQGCKPNCIYFTDHGLGHRNIPRGLLNDEEIDEWSVCDMGMYDLGDQTFERFSQLNMKYHVPPIWISPNPQ